MNFQPRRSVLYMPGANARALEKARSLAADALILDLEDSVEPEEKALARDLVAAALKTGGYGPREICVRINASGSPWMAEDLAMAVASGAQAILLPKVNDPSDLVQASRLKPAAIALWAMIETPQAVLQAEAIAREGRGLGLQCFIIGTNDLVKESRMRSTGQRFALVPALAHVVLAARTAGISVIDGVYNDIRDEAGLRAECEQGLALGMDGKTLIHPGQIALANEIFAPSPQEIAQAQAIVAAFAAAEAQGKGVITLNGRMVERLHLEMAERSLAIAAAIAARAETAT